MVAAGVASPCGLPYLSYAAKIEPGDGRVVVHRISPVGYDVLEAALPALVVATQALGEPRYPSLKGIMGARSKEIQGWSLADRRASTGEPGRRAGNEHRRRGPQASGPRGDPGRSAGRPASAASQIVEFLAERRLI